ncbi:MAG: NRDE family protein [Pseudomonadota bacterium]|nr:NRDE family protein [Pseudomonadota bacterium]
MCLAVIALDAHPRYAVVVAANRDEFHARPAQAAQWWNGTSGASLLAGRDLEQGGTWLGLAPSGRWAFVTNVREPGRHDPHAPSRGALVPALLRDRRPIIDAMASIVLDAQGCNGFNLAGGEGIDAAFGSNRGSHAVVLGRGIHGVSNAQLDTPWPKLVRAKAGLAAWAAAGRDDLDPLWSVLVDRTLACDAELPDTGLARERERLLSSPFIVSEGYGTRCATLVALSRDGGAQFVERSFDASGATTGEVAFRFDIDHTASSITR